MELSVELTAAQERVLQGLAQRLNVPVEKLAGAVLGDLLERRDADFEAAVQHVLAKNAELYRRLA